MNNHEDTWKLALQILRYRSYSEYELRQKLYSKDCVADQIDDVINRLLTYGYINDNKLANILFEKYLQVGKYSLNNIICKLKQRGLSDDVIQHVTNNYDSNEEWTLALKLVNSRFKSLEDINKEKIYRFLATRGFGAAAIRKVFQQMDHDETE